MSDWDYYASSYQDYARQNPPHKLAFYLKLLGAYLSDGDRIFELGTGMGSFLERASARYQCSGCDINEVGVAATRDRVPGCDVAVGSYELVPASDDLRAVVSWDVLEHLEDLPAALAHIAATLCSGAYLMGVVPVYDGPLGWLVHLLDKDETHVTKRGRGFWLQALAGAGLEVVRWGGINRKLVGKRYVHITRPQTLLRRVGTAMFFVARKPG